MEHKLDNHPNVEKWAYIPHDSDVDEDGKPVAPHIHLVLGLNESLNTSTIGNIIGVPQQYVSPIKQKIKAGRSYRADIGGALLYLTHRNAPEKHQYSDDQVVAKAGYDWIAERAKSEKAQEANKSFQKAIEGINKMQIFNDDADNIQFLHFLEFTQTDEFQILAYCLMGNHAHLLMVCLSLFFICIPEWRPPIAWRPRQGGFHQPASCAPVQPVPLVQPVPSASYPA